MNINEMTSYHVPRLREGRTIKVSVPGSKSITNRALLLAALSNKRCYLSGVLFSDDSRAFLDSLMKLGFFVEIKEEEKSVVLQGTGGKIPNPRATINVRSAGTAARFLTVFLALAGGEYELQASEQMCKRPMQPLLEILQKAGVIFEYHGEEGHFPFTMRSGGVMEKEGDLPGLFLHEVSVDTEVSSQFASALMMSGVLLEKGLLIHMVGDRVEGAYIKMTLSMMRQFGIDAEMKNGTCYVKNTKDFGLSEYEIEPDVSGACYFYAMAPLLKTDVTVFGVHKNSLQGDIKFLEALQQMGCSLYEEAEGIRLSGRSLSAYHGLEISMKDFSDQTMTMAAIAPFADTPTLIKNVGHIQFQESDRLHAILKELSRMGIRCEEVKEEAGLRIYPGEIREAQVETYEDHRMAMAFSLPGVKTGKITIKNPGCCRKTFESYFELIDMLADGQEV